MDKNIRNSWKSGFVDGEGCITITKQIRKGRPSPSFRPMVTISNTIRKSLEVFVEDYGGTLRERTDNRLSKKGYKISNVFTWYCPQGKVVEFMNDIKPYSIIKIDNINIMLSFMDHLHNSPRNKGGRFINGSHKGSEPLNKETIQVREDFRKKIQSFNSRRKYE